MTKRMKQGMKEKLTSRMKDSMNEVINAYPVIPSGLSKCLIPDSRTLERHLQTFINKLK